MLDGNTKKDMRGGKETEPPYRPAWWLASQKVAIPVGSEKWLKFIGVTLKLPLLNMNTV